MSADLPAIRIATVGDAESLSRFAAEAFRVTFAPQNDPADMAAYLAAAFSPEIQHAEIADPSTTVLIAEDAAGIAGYAQTERDAGGIQLKRLYVDGNHKGTGLARALTGRVLDLARAERAARVWLGVWEHNPRAIAFYRKAGFVVVGSQIFQVGTDPQIDLVMELRLQS